MRMEADAEQPILSARKEEEGTSAMSKERGSAECEWRRMRR